VAKSVAASGQRALPYDRAALTVPHAKLAATLARLQSDRRVDYATLDQRVHATDAPNDACYTGASTCVVYPLAPTTPPPPQGSTNPMGTLASINAPGAWAVTHSGVPVAVLDSGVDRGHPDLANKVDLVGETLCKRTDPTAPCADSEQDLLGHGTHVSGIIAAATNNSVGIAGAGWNTTVRMYKVLDDNGNGFASDVAIGIRDATNQGFRVINMSPPS
jgi:subtilisin family serine protease